VRWDASPPPVQGFSREDHYLSEGQWHVQRRNVAISGGDWWAAWSENAILERFYAPVLDRGARWSVEQRAGIEQSARGTARGPYVSDAAPYPIYLVRRPTLWAVTALLGGAIVLLSRGSAFARATS
jgi:hypothetical protein